MKFPLRLALVVVSLGFVSCSTPYKKFGVAGGYSELRLAPDVVKVTFTGNGYTSMEKAEEMAMLRLCEICLESGYTHFRIIGSGSDSREVAVHSPGASTTSGQVLPGGQFSSTTYTSPGFSGLLSFPKPMILAKLSKGASNTVAWDAKFISDQIRAKYKIKPRPPTGG